MKISVISNSSGEIVGASFTPPKLARPVDPRGTDEIKVPEGHRVHHVNLPAELADEFLSGNFARAFSQYTLEVKGKKAILTRQVSKKGSSGFSVGRGRGRCSGSRSPS